MRERLQVDVGHAARQCQGVAANSINQRSRQALADFLVSRHQVLGHDGRGRAVLHPHVLERSGATGVAGMMIDRDIGARDFLAEERRLNIDHRNLVELAQGLGRGRLDFDFQQMHHREVFRPRDGLEREQRRGLLVASQQSAQSYPARHRIGVGVVLQHDRDAIAVGDHRAQILDFLLCEGLIHRSERIPCRVERLQVKSNL